MSPFPLALAAALLAHNPDTSYVRVTISPDKIETRLTYDVFTLLKITPLDDNQDNKLQRSELDNHAPQIAAYLKSKIGLATSEDDEEADIGQFRGFLWPPDLGDAIPAADFHSQNGLIPFDFVRPIEFVPEEVAIAFGFFDRFTDRHTVLGVFKYEQHEFETTFNAYTPDFTYITGMETPLSHRLRKFFVMGVEHIFLGYDHICFLIALIVVSRFREIIKIVTSFTIAHSITLILATLEVVSLPSRLIETSIALTIVYVALENIYMLLRRASAVGKTDNGFVSPSPPPPLPLSPHASILKPQASSPTPHSAFRIPRWLLTFLFGLIHGFGFANVLRELGLPTSGLLRCLLSFNIGVEFGQLAIAICLLPLAYLLHYWKYGRYVAISISALLALFGLAWFIDRAFNLELMQRLSL